MDNLVVGNDDCKFARVIVTMSNSPAFSILSQKWHSVFQELGTPKELRDNLQIKRNLLNISTESIVEEILMEWRNRCSKDAKLLNLIELFETNDLNDIAENLKEEFGTLDQVDECSSTLDLETEEVQLQDHLQYYLVDLIDKTYLSDTLIEKMKTNGILIDEEVQILKAIFSREDTNRLFYKFVGDRIAINEDLYDVLISVFQEDPKNHKNGVSCLLNKFYN